IWISTLSLHDALPISEIESIVKVATDAKIAGLIATNTTISREGLQTSHDEVERYGAGGLSGAPLRQRSSEVISLIFRMTKGRLRSEEHTSELQSRVDL